LRLLEVRQESNAMKTKLMVLGLTMIAGLAWVEARTWTQAETGRTLEGEYRGLEGDELTVIRTNGTALKMSLASLSDEDQAYVAEQAKAAEEEAAAAVRPEVTHKKGAKLEVGDVIDMSFRSVNAGEVDLAEMKDKVVLLDFWATWCGPCVAELPNVKKAYEKYHEKGFEILGISLDSDKGSLEKFIEKNDMPWPQYFDGKGWQSDLGQEYGINSIPAVYLVRNNEVVATGVRGGALEAKLKELLD
jgi:thiol-disulfide isomerase/thioredoxin